MENILKNLTQNISGEVIEKIASSSGANTNSVKVILDKAVPAMTGAMAKNAKNLEGAKQLTSALDKDHDGSIFSHIEDVFSQDGITDGNKILGHIFGNELSGITENISGKSGTDSQSTSKILAMIAPLVLGSLGKTKNDLNMDSDMLSKALDIASVSTKGGFIGMLDLDKDGSVVDDIPKVLGFLGIIKNFFGKK